MDFLILLFGGAVLGLVGVLVRLAGDVGVGPFGSAFWRMALATPVLVGWALLASWSARRKRSQAEALPHAQTVAVQPVSGNALRIALSARGRPPQPLASWPQGWLLAFAAVMFAGDLILFHLGLFWSTVANATMESNLAPIVITLAFWTITRVAPRGVFLLGLAASLAGALLMIGPHFDHSRALLGDVCGIFSAVFYAGYQIGVQQARQKLDTLHLMAWVTAGATLALWPFALAEARLWPTAAIGWVWLVLLALVVQIGGQVVIAYAVKHLSPALSSVGLLVQPATSAVYAWLLLGEGLGAWQLVGAGLLLAGIYLARRGI